MVTNKPIVLTVTPIVSQSNSVQLLFSKFSWHKNKILSVFDIEVLQHWMIPKLTRNDVMYLHQSLQFKFYSSVLEMLFRDAFHRQK